MKKITMLFLATLVFTFMWIPTNAQTNLQLRAQQATDGVTPMSSNSLESYYSRAGENNAVIFQQSEGAGGNGIVSDYYVPSNTGAYSADDFSLETEEDIFLFNFQGFGGVPGTGIEPVLAGFQMYIYADAGGEPAGYPSGTVEPLFELDLNWDETNGPDAGLSYEKVEIEGLLPRYFVTIDVEEASGNALTLGAGTYWVIIAGKINGNSTDTPAPPRFNWTASDDANGALPKLTDPQGLFGSDENWVDINTLVGAPDYNALTFTVYGPLLADCNGMPDAGVAMVTPESENPGATYNVSAQGFSAAPGISFQWQSNTNGAGWIDEGTATTSYEAYTATAPAQIGDVVEWRLASTCVATEDTAYSDIATFTVAVTYCEAEGGNTDFESISNVTYAGINNATTTQMGYNDFTAQVATVTQADVNQLSVTINADGSDSVYAFIDWNQNGILDDAGEVYTLVSSTSENGPFTMDITVPANAELGNTRMRVKVVWNESTPIPCGDFSFGEVEDYTVLVNPAIACSGMPDGGVATVDPEIGNVNSTYTVSATGYSGGSGLTYQWQSNTNGAGWIDEGTAMTSYETFSATAPGQIEDVVEWRLASTCVATTDTAYSDIATFTVAITYCEAEGGNTAYESISNVTYAGINNATTTQIGYNDFTAQVATVTQAGVNQLSVTINADGSDSVYAFIDWNQNGVLDDAGEVYTLVSSTSENGPFNLDISVPATAELGNTRLRVKAVWNESTPIPCGTFSFGEVEDYTVLVNPAMDCSGTPDGGEATVDPEIGNVNSTYTVSATGYSAGNGLTYQWQSNTDGAGWIDEGGLEDHYTAFAATASSEFDSVTEWRLEVSCTISGESSYSTVATFATSATFIYCIPVLDCTDGDNILNVAFQGIDNTTTCSPDGYGDFTSLVGSVLSGDTNEISVTVGDGFSNESVSVWIDFNENGTFDQDEFFYIGTGSAEVLTGDITIPTGLAIGEYTMRVRVAAVGATTATWDMACDEDQFYGETEDYTIEVTGALSVNDNTMLSETRLYPNPLAQDTFYIHAPKLNGEQVGVNITDMAGRQIFSNNITVNDNKVTVSGNDALTSGMYLVTLKHGGESHTFRVVKK